MKNTIQQLEKIKKKLEDLKEEQIEIKTKKRVILDNLKKEYNCKTIDEAEKLLKKLTTECDEKEEILEEEIEELISEMTDNGVI